MIPWFVTPALAATAPCLDEARQGLEQIWPEAAVALRDAPDDVFSTFLRCDRPDLGLRVAVHESLHAVSGRDEEGVLHLTQIGADPLSVTVVTTQPASVVSRRLSARERTGFHDAYLVGRPGEQPLTYLLDELNAYVWTLELAQRMQSWRPQEGVRSSDRDGLAVMQWFVLLYLDELRRKVPTEHGALVASPADQQVIIRLFELAAERLDSTCADPHLGIEDGYWLARVYGRDGRAWYERATGQTLTLPAGCEAVVAAAPAKPRLADAEGAIKEQARLTRRTVVEVITVTIEGEELTLEELEARAADDPKWREILDQVRAQLAATEE